MLNEAIKQYLEAHGVQKIGTEEFIVDNPLEYINLISNSDCYICKMLWWEHIEIEKQKQSMGGGGAVDSHDKRFMYSEVYYLSKNFSENDSELCRAYLLETPKMYQDHNLVPSFVIKERVTKN